MDYSKSVRLAFAAAVAFSGFLVSETAGAQAASQKSVFSSLNLKRCKLTNTYEQGAEWSCPGYRGMRVRIAEGDLRFSIAYGKNWKKQMSRNQFLSPFNTIGKTMEWRVRGRTPEATIVRYFTDEGSGGKKGQILVVTKIGKKNACHMGYVDARANKRANRLAQDLAAGARSFRCGRDQAKFLGKRGVSPF